MALRILTYHYLLERPPSSAAPAPATYTVTPDQFTRELQLLQREGYSFVHFDELPQIKLNQREQDKFAIVGIDGFNEQWIPLLEGLQLPITIFFVTSWFGTAKDYIRFPSIDRCRELFLRNPNLKVGCHSHSHEDLRPRFGEQGSEYRDRLYAEIIDSVNFLEKAFDQRVVSYALPYGVINDTDDMDLLLKIAQEAGISVVRGTRVSTQWQDQGIYPHHYEAKGCSTHVGLRNALRSHKGRVFLLGAIASLVHHIDVFQILVRRIGFRESIWYYWERKILPRLRK